MLIWLTIILVIIFSVLSIIFRDDYELGYCMCGSLAVIMSIVVAVMGLACLVCNVGLEGRIAECDARYESLVYQLENNLYDNDNDLGKRELYVDIQAWNEDLARNKANQDDFWIGVFTPNIYDAFEFIELE